MEDSATFHYNGSEIAIIGLSGRFPGAKNLEEFWHNLQAGVESITFFTDEELVNSGIDPVLVDNPKYVKARGVLADAELFDASFFGFTPREAEITDPQHRLFLECAWSALENAGYNSENYAGAIGVYAGSGLSGYLFNVYTNENLRNYVDIHQITIGGDKDYLSTRISYKLNLTGPSYTIQTACSTSLVAVHLACQSLLNGECDMALAGGVSISTLRKHGYFYKEGGIGSPDGHCRAFDAKAQGTVGGEGVGIVVLKRLEDAIADQDTIHAVIKGSATNNDGSQKVSFTAPSIDTQAKVIRTAQAVAEVAPETITYIEAHGTGTSLGDPIEIAALTEAFRASTDKTGFCAIGSLKTNTGHLDAAAGVAGLIKTVLALKHKKIPASLHFEQPNPQIDFVNSPFYVNTQLTEWQTNGTPRRAGVSSFGIGGTNAHVILEEAPKVKQEQQDREYQLLVVSAKTSTALETATQNLANYLQQNQDLNLGDVAYTLAVGRKALEHRRILVCQNLENAITALTSLDSPEVFTHYQKPCHRPVVFMFPGQGSQYVNMGRELYETEAYFREQVDYCAELLKPHLGFDLRDVIYPNATQTQELTQTAITQPALFVIEYALAKLWMNWGIRPEAMIGHSIGEYVAATLAGVFSLEDALKLVAHRGRLMQQLPEGAMLSVQMGESEILPLLGAELALAASNSPSSCVVSGAINAIAKLEHQLQQQGINCRRLHTCCAFHSPMMEAMIEPFTKSLQQIPLHPPQIPFISNVSGTWISATAATDPNYWAKHLRQTVLFSDGITELQKQPERIFLEVGPGRTLSTFIKHHQNSEVITLTSLRHPQEQKSDVTFIFNTLGRLWLQGIKVDWSSFYSHEKPYHIPLPTYPFERQRYWVEAQPNSAHIIEYEKLLQKKSSITDWFYIPSWKESKLVETFVVEEVKAQKICWLVFIDTCGLGKELVKKLKQQKHNVVTVMLGEQFARLDDHTYIINPQNSGDYETLLQTLRALNWKPNAIAHLFNITPYEPIHSLNQDFATSQDLGFYSLLFLAQALDKQNITDSLPIIVVTNNLHDVTGEERLSPEKATALGICKVIGQEYPNINCRSVDVVIPESPIGKEKLINHLIAEFALESTDLVIAYRGNHRWIQIYEPVRLDTAIETRTRLSKNGVYLLTGGLGGIGLVLAQHLAQTVQAKLILIGRSSFPKTEEWDEWIATHGEQDKTSRKIQKIKALQELGAEVLVISADVANLEQMQIAITQAYEHFGKINGVIHAAGIVENDAFAPIQEISKTQCERQFQPKVHGLFVLEKVLQGREIDFCLLLSSLASVLGGLGFVAYSAANLFMDAFAHQHNQINSVPWISVNWDGWQLEDKEEQNTTLQTTVAKLSLTPKEGAEVFQRILSIKALNQIVISTGDLQTRIEQWLKRQAFQNTKHLTKSHSLSFHSRERLQNVYVAPSNEIERSLADFWQQILGIEQVGIHDNFFELGGDSLVATQLVSQLCQHFQIKLPYQSFFNQPTIAEIANMILQNITEQANEEELAQALAEIEQLSEDEIQIMLTLPEQLIEIGGNK